jgi:hypothetical protein
MFLALDKQQRDEIVIDRDCALPALGFRPFEDQAMLPGFLDRPLAV